jgi:hypothetical protein
MVREASPSLLLSRPQGNELDLLATQLDLKLIAGFEAQLGGVGLADEQIAVELDLGREAQATAMPPLAAIATAVTKADALGLQQGFIEGSEVQALGAVLFGADIAGGANQIGFRDIAEFFDLGEQCGSSEYGEWKMFSGCMVSNRLELSMA